MLSAAEGHQIQTRLFCQFNEVVVRAKAVRLNRGLGCKWQYFFIECPIRDEMDLAEFNLTNVALSTKHPVSSC